MFFSTKSSRDISERQSQLQTELEQTRNTIREVETRAAQALAEGASTGADFGAVASLKAKEEATRSALAILQAEKTAAEKRERIADAKAKRELAQQKRTEAASIAGKLIKLLEKLSEIEGVEYDTTILCAQRIGTWIRDRVFIDQRIPDSLRSPFEAGGPDPASGPVWYAVPRSRALINEALKLEDEAETIERAEGLEVHAEAAELRKSANDVAGLPLNRNLTCVSL